MAAKSDVASPGLAPIPGSSHQDDRGGYDCEFVEPPPAAFQTECPVCLHILKEPCVISCPCGQKICRECVEQIKKDNKPCPLCNKTDITFMRDYGLERSLKEFEVWCSKKKDGCEWKGKLGEYEQHLNQNPSPENQLTGCQFVEVECEHGCGEWFQRHHIAAHQNQECPERPYSCEYCCEYESAFKDVTTSHFSQCSRYPVTCPNKCQEDQFARQELENHLENECPHEEVNCPLHYAGCEVRLPRKDMPEHMRDTVTHLTLLATVTQTLLKENKELQQKVEERDSKVAELSQSLQAHEAKIQNLNEKVQLLTVQKLGLPGVYHVKDDKDVFLPAFYTHSSGYRMCVQVAPMGTGTHVSIFTCLMRGQFDDHLKWPFRGEITIQIVNQAGDHSHVEKTITYDDSAQDNAAGRVNDAKRSIAMGHYQFLARSELCYNPEKNTQYSKNGIIIVRIVKSSILF